MLTRPSPSLSTWNTPLTPHDSWIQSPLTSCGISCRRMAIVVRNPTCSRGEKVIRKQSPSSERWSFHQHIKASFSKLRLVTVQMTNMTQIRRSSPSEGLLFTLVSISPENRKKHTSLGFLHVVSHLRTGLSSSVHSWWQKPYLSANQEAGCYCQAVCKVINGVGQQIEVSTNLQREGRAPDKGSDITR